MQCGVRQSLGEVPVKCTSMVKDPGIEELMENGLLFLSSHISFRD